MIFLVGWTLLAGFVIFRLAVAQSGSSVVFLNQTGVPDGQPHHGLQGFFKSELALGHLCPWILLGPYAWFLALRFPFERQRLKVTVPINAAGALGFLVGACLIGSLDVFTRGTLIIVRQGAIDGHGTGGPDPTNHLFTDREVWRTADVLSTRVVQTGPGGHESNRTSLTNWTAEFRPGASLPAPPDAGKLALWPRLVDLLAYGMIIGGAHSVYLNRRLREREQSALALESDLARAQLNTLKAQLQPHFLFNSLNAVVALVKRDPAAAQATLVSLGDLLRMALKFSERQEIPLREELEFVDRYVDIQRTRFGSRLQVEQQVDAAALDALTPTLLLQPLVENAIRHGIEPSRRPGNVGLTVRRSGDRLVLVVEDNGVGLPGDGGRPHSTGSPGSGIGLKNLRSRLERLYGGNQALELVANAAGGVTVRVEIPWRIPAPGTEADC